VTAEEFNKLAENFRAAEMALMRWKREDYSPREDVLENFRQVGDVLGIRASVVACTYLLKHVLAVLNAVRGGKYVWDWQTPDGREGLKQRIVDARNYLLLLAACVEEECNDGNPV
jgi:hypothetical protein